MRKIYLAMGRELVVAEEINGRWKADRHLVGLQPTCLASDPGKPNKVYCGTYARGLWVSEDAGGTWRPAADSAPSLGPLTGRGIRQPSVMSLAVSYTERVDGLGVVYAGTEPSALYRSEDGGESWRELTGLVVVPSAMIWSFPPRPHTSHIRWVTPDPNQEGRLFVCAEAGALLRSSDGGDSWEDRNFLSPRDTHTLAMHPLAPGRLYSAAGDGFAEPGRGYSESPDGGNTWLYIDQGLEHHYLWGLAVDPADPDTVLVSAASSPGKAHGHGGAPGHTELESFIYRKSGDSPWQRVYDGLPDPEGTYAPVLATNIGEPHLFYALTNKGLYQSSDAGLSWQELNVPWQEYYLRQHQQALLVVEE